MGEPTAVRNSVSLDGYLSVGFRDTLTDLWRGRSLWGHLGRPRVSLTTRRTVDVAIFDVFDTLITRVAIHPEKVWSRMAQLLRDQGLVTVSTERVVEARAAAQLRVDHEDFPVLERIHQEMSELLGLGEALVPRSIATEIQVEKEMSRPIPAGIELLHSVRAVVPRIVYASDMHLPSTTIRDLLRRHGCWAEGDTLWVSAAAGARKRTGEMFNHIAEVEQVSPKQMLHVGDQPFADSAAPRWLGVTVAPFKHSLPNRYERALIADQESLGLRLADAGRIARLAHDDIGRGVVDVVTGVIGPFLVGYALWLLSQAQKRGLERLYFLSRDGEILLRATSAVSNAIGEGPELRYLYGGRMAWMLPATDVDSDHELARFLDHVVMKHSRVTLSGLSMRLGISTTELQKVVGADPTEPLDPAQRAKLRVAVESGDLRDAIKSYAAEQAELSIEYLRLEGLGEKVPSAIVDVGWVGSTMRALASLLEGWAQPPLSLFVGYSGPSVGLPGGHAAYLWNGSDCHSRGSAAGLTTLIEMFCSGSHGGVAGYEAAPGRVTPRLLVDRSIPAESWPLADMHAVVATFLREVSLLLDGRDLEAPSRAAVMQVLRLFRTTPTSEEAIAWGSFPREEDPQGESVFPMARPYAVADLPLLVRPGPFAGRNLTWPEAAVKMTSRSLRPLITTTLLFASLTRQVRSRIATTGDDSTK